jgi:mono/diheme cytochrome c family protein
MEKRGESRSEIPTVIVLRVSLALACLLGVGAPPARAEDAAARGKQVFVTQGCYGCHTVEKFGTPIATDLTTIGTRYPPAALVRWLRDPSAERATAHMPKLALTEDEIASLAAYLSSPRQ